MDVLDVLEVMRWHRRTVTRRGGMTWRSSWPKCQMSCRVLSGGKSWRLVGREFGAPEPVSAIELLLAIRRDIADGQADIRELKRLAAQQDASNAELLQRLKLLSGSLAR